MRSWFRSDTFLVQAVLRCTPGAWEQFVTSLSAPVYRVCTSFLNSPDADQLFTGYFADLRDSDFRALRGYQGHRGPLATYLVCDAHSYCLRQVLGDLARKPGLTDVIWRKLEENYRQQLRKLIERVILRANREDFSRDDLYQDLLVHLMEDQCARLRRFSGTGSFSNWLGKVATNFILDRLRKQPPPTSIDGGAGAAEREDGQAPGGLDPADPAPLPDQRLAQEDEAGTLEAQVQRMRRSLSKLSERSRLCLQLKYWEGHRPAAIAEFLGEPVDRVYKTLEKNMGKLRTRMGAQDERGKSPVARLTK